MKKWFVAVIVFVAVSGGLAKSPYTLVYKPQLGKGMIYATESQQKTTQEMAGQEIVSEGSSQSKIELMPQSLSPNDNFICIARYLDKSTKLKNRLMDTTLVESDQCNKRVEIEFDKLGKVLQVTLLDSFPQPAGMMRMGAIDPKLAFKRLLRELPDRPVDLGDTWTKVTIDSISVMGMKLNVTTDPKFTLVGEEEMLGYKCLKVTYTGNVSVEGKGSQMGNEFFFEGSGKAEGTFYFAPEEGLLVSEEVITDQEMTIAISGQVNMTIPQTTSTHSKTVLVK